jgi:hypothetical protein
MVSFKILNLQELSCKIKNKIDKLTCFSPRKKIEEH